MPKKIEVGVIFRVLNKAVEPLRKLRKNFTDASKTIEQTAEISGEGSAQMTEGFDKTVKSSKGFKTAGDRIKGFTRKVVASIFSVRRFVGIAGVAVGVLGALVAKFSSGLVASKNFAASIGISVKDLEELRYVAQTAGLAAGDMDAMLQQLYDTMFEATTTSKDAGAVLGSLGVKYATAKGKLRPVVDVFEDVVKELSLIEDRMYRDKLAVEIFGGAASKMTNIWAKGNKEFEQTRKEIRDGLGILPKKVYEGAVKTNKNLILLGKNLKGIMATILAELSPDITKFVKWLVDYLTKNAGNIRKWIATTFDLIKKQINDIINLFQKLVNLAERFKIAPKPTGKKTAIPPSPIIPSVPSPFAEKAAFMPSSMIMTGRDSKIEISIKTDPGTTAIVSKVENASQNLIINTTGAGYRGPVRGV